MSKISEISDRPLIYIGQSYKANPEKAFENAKLWSAQLVDKYDFFSPILNSHPLALSMGKKGEEVDWVALDLRLCERFLKGSPVTIDIGGDDPNVWEIGTGTYDLLSLGGKPDPIGTKYYDKGLIMAFASDCWKVCSQADYDAEKEAFYCGKLWCIGNWASKGAKQEYEWAKEHHVRCVPLVDVLTKEEKDWRTI